jgi:hypothetical protein
VTPQRILSNQFRRGQLWQVFSTVHLISSLIRMRIMTKLNGVVRSFTKSYIGPSIVPILLLIDPSRPRSPLSGPSLTLRLEGPEAGQNLEALAETEHD